MDRVTVINGRFLVLSLAVFLSMTPILADAEELDPLYAKFLESISQDDIACAYTRTYSSEDSGVQVEHYSPDSSWRLVSVDGTEPSESELDDYMKEEDERVRRRNAPSDLEFFKSTMSDVVQTSQDAAETIEFDFKPKMSGEFPSAMEEKLSGRLTVARDGMRPLEYVISLDEPASPMPSVKLRNFEQHVAFVADSVTGAKLIKSMTFSAHGRALVVKRIAREESVVFSDFDCQVVASESSEL